MSSAAPALILGSTSRYRRELLSRLRLPFTVAAPDVDETPQTGETPEALARRLAVIMHRIWVDGTEFRWTREAATA